MRHKHNKLWVGNGDFLKRIIANVQVNGDRTDDDDMLKDFFEN